MLATLPAPVRHVLLLLAAALLTGLAEVLPSLDIPTTVLPFITAAIALALAWVTPLIQAYGVGKDRGGQPAATDNGPTQHDPVQDASQDPEVIA